MPASHMQKCPACGAMSSGKFCSECGAPLGGATCPSCGAKVPARARFCGECGAPIGATVRLAPTPARAASARDRMAWYVAGLAVIALLVVIVIVVGRRSAPPAAAAAAPASERATTDLSSMSPREQADRLYNRIMTASEAGDTSQVSFFGPMGLQAYANLGPDLDPDARLHVGLIDLALGAAPAAAAQGDTILRATPTHLFGFLLRARAAEAEGNQAAEHQADRAFASNYAAEQAKKRPEYAEHAQMLQDELARARQAGGS
jgi:hypothetical protein